jgi:hypothetical protein
VPMMIQWRKMAPTSKELLAFKVGKHKIAGRRCCRDWIYIISLSQTLWDIERGAKYASNSRIQELEISSGLMSRSETVPNPNLLCQNCRYQKRQGVYDIS